MRDFKKFIPLLLSVILLILFNNHSYSQSIAKIENIAFNREGPTMIITYDIVKAQTGEKFNIGVIITSESGNNIIPFSIYGDINKDVSGGINKKIIWEIDKDGVPLDEKISIDIIFQTLTIQKEETTQQTITKAPEFRRNIDIGAGMLGLDYGGIIGLKFEYIPLNHLGVFTSVGIQLTGFAWQVGAIGYIIRKTNKKGFRPYGKFMFGTNAFIFVQDMTGLNGAYLGPTIGVGMEIRFGGAKRSGLNFDISIPFRSQKYEDDWEALKNNPTVEVLSEPLPFTFSIGYHVEF